MDASIKIAVWYHCRLSGAGIPSTDASVEILYEQMQAIKASGLSEAASEIHAGINGGDGEALTLSSLLPEKSVIHVHGSDSRWEYPTLFAMQRWLKPRWAVLYHHSKGVTNPGDAFHHHHRRTMENALVWQWQRCVSDIERGYEAVGINLVDPITRPVLPGKFFAGNFWWASSEWLMRLPQINPREENRMHAEGWIFSIPRRAIAIDYERPNLAEWCRDMVKT